MAIGMAALLITGFLPSIDYALAIDKKFDYRINQKVKKAITDLENKKGNIQREAKKDLISWGADSVEPLIAVVRDWEHEPADLRVACVDILGEIKDKRAVPVIIDAANENRMTMKYSAARALGNIGDKRAAPVLIKLLNDKEWQVRLYATEALGKIGDISGARPLANLLLADPNDKVRLAAIEALDKLNARTEYKTVLEAFSDNDPQIRSYAVELSASWTVKEAMPAIMGMLKSDRSNTVRASCAHTLGIFANYSAVPALIDALSDDYKDVRIYALDSLKKMSNQNYGSDKEAWSHWFELNKDKAKQQ